MHGIFQNAWWDRERRKQITCTDDPRRRDIGYGMRGDRRRQRLRLQVPTFTDVMRSQRKAHVVVAGAEGAQRDHARRPRRRRGHLAHRLARRLGDVEGVSPKRRCRRSRRSSTRTRLPPISARPGIAACRPRHTPSPTRASAKRRPRGWTRSFPHVLKAPARQADGAFLRALGTQPVRRRLSRTVRGGAGRIAAARRSTTAPTCSRSASRRPDLVGHAFGPRSQEIQDMYAHLDQTIGTLFDRLDAMVGKDRWVAGLTADHGVTPIPEQLTAEGKDAGRVNVSGMSTPSSRRCSGARRRPARDSAQHQRHLFRAGHLRQDSEVARICDDSDGGDRSATRASQRVSSARTFATAPSPRIRRCGPPRSAISPAAAATSSFRPSRAG